ncbi:MAG: hypothetical protein AB1726_00120 [Planctomycetota bacterium]
MKLLLKLLVLFAILFVGLVAVLLLRVDSLVRVAVERGGTYALGVETRLDEADVRVFAGEVSLAGLTVANPPGFQQENFLAMGSAAGAADLTSLSADTVEVPLLELTGLVLDVERGPGGTNYGIILDHLQRFESGAGEAKGEGEEEGPAAPGKKLLVGRISLRDISVTVNLLPAGGELTRQTLTLPPIELRDVGTAEGGASLADVVSRIVTALLEATVQAGQGLVPADLLQDLSGELAGLESAAGAALEGAKEQAEKLGEEVRSEVEEKLDGATKEVEKRLEGLLGGKKGG